MNRNRDERITFRVDPQTAAALDRYVEASKRKKSDVVHEALHRFLLEHDFEYVRIIGTSETISASDSAAVMREIDRKIENVSAEREELEERALKINAPRPKTLPPSGTLGPFSPFPYSPITPREMGDALNRRTAEARARDITIRLNEPGVPYAPRSDKDEKED
jgi:hypothetical protein